MSLFRVKTLNKSKISKQRKQKRTKKKLFQIYLTPCFRQNNKLNCMKIYRHSE